jgi:dihydroflavonol-4-reductase
VKLKGKAIAVTGGTGMIGQAICRHLADAGANVTALSRHGMPMPDEIASAKADILDAALDLSDYDTVVHAAAFVGFGLSKQKEALMHRTNVEGTQNVLDAAVRAGMKRALHVSSVAAIGRTGGVSRDEDWVWNRPLKFHSAYEHSKYDAHVHALHRKDIDVVSVMPSVVVGLGDSSSGLLLKRFLQLKIPLVPRHPGSIAVVHVEDVAAGTVVALEKGSGAYVLNQESVSVPELFARFSRATGAPLPKMSAPFWSLRAAASLEPVLRALGMRPAMSKDFVRSLRSHTVFDARRAKHDLGWSPDMDRHLAADGQNWQNAHPP